MTTAEDEPPAVGSGASAPLPNPALVRALKFVVVALALLIFVGVGAVISRIIYLAREPAAQHAILGRAAETGGPAPEAMLDLPAGAVVKSVSLSGDRLAVLYEVAGESAIAVVDLENGRTLARLRTRSPAAAR
jgi:hypothetical protein